MIEKQKIKYILTTTMFIYFTTCMFLPNPLLNTYQVLCALPKLKKIKNKIATLQAVRKLCAFLPVAWKNKLGTIFVGLINRLAKSHLLPALLGLLPDFSSIFICIWYMILICLITFHDSTDKGTTINACPVYVVWTFNYKPSGKRCLLVVPDIMTLICWFVIYVVLDIYLYFK